MNIPEENHRRLVSFFQSGAKKTTEVGNLGVEVEHQVVGFDGEPISYEPKEGRVGIRQVLEHLATWYPQRSFNDDHDLLGLLGPEGSVTLEPAAQLELSIAPYADVADVAQAYRHFREHVDPFLSERGAQLVPLGYHPTHKAQQLTLIPKRRYDFMDAYFATIGSHGDRMMRASASTQVSVDFVDEADAVRKMRVAAALAPILAAIADNTPVFEGTANSTPIRRLQLWREVDNLRCGTIPGIFHNGFGFDAYADWVLRAPPIFVTRTSADDPEGPQLRPFFSEPAELAYADAPLSDADVEHAISMFWPDVRLKRFVEVRPADSLPAEQILGYTALIKGIFYSETSLRAIEDALGVDPEAAQDRRSWPIDTDDVSEAIRETQSHGFDALIYGTSLSSWEETLFDLADRSLPTDERAYLQPLRQFAADKSWWKTEGQGS